MRILVVISALVACALAEPQLVKYDYSGIIPLFGYHYSPGYIPIAYTPTVKGIIPTVTPWVKADIKSQYHTQDGFGQTSYGHYEPRQFHTAVHDAFGNKAGSFSYLNAEGKVVHTNYIADAFGYRVSSNDLPVAPVHSPVAPSPPAETTEVLAARAAHLAEVEKVRGRSKRDADIVPASTFPAVRSNELLPYDYRFVGYPYNYLYSGSPYYRFAGFPNNVIYSPHVTPVPGVVPPGFYHNDSPDIGKVPGVPEVADIKTPVGVQGFPRVGANGFITEGGEVSANKAPVGFQPEIPQISPTGYLNDTPEVAAAKAKHFAEVAVAQSQAQIV